MFSVFIVFTLKFSIVDAFVSVGKKVEIGKRHVEIQPKLFSVISTCLYI